MTKVDTSESGPDGRRARLWNEIRIYQARIVSLGKEIAMLNESIAVRRRELAAMDRHPSVSQTDHTTEWLADFETPEENDALNTSVSESDPDRPCS